jgi:ABC-type multidrug transport system fused ATPase/permease subunit
MPIFGLFHSIFKRKCKLLWGSVRKLPIWTPCAGTSNWIIVQTLIVKNWIRKVQTTTTTQNCLDKTILITHIFFHWYYFVTWFYCALWNKILNGDTLPLWRFIFVHHVHRMLFNPCAKLQINSTKCNWAWLQQNRFFDILDTEDQIQDMNYWSTYLKGDIRFEKVRFGYIPDEEVIKGIDLGKCWSNNCHCIPLVQ